MSSACLRIGIDCGGTNTDAAVLDQDDRVLGWAKAVTTEDVLGGVAAAVRGALASARREPAEVAAMMLGTTQFVNATVQLRGLARVAVVRLCGPATHALPPCCDMPPALRAAVGGCTFLAAGGFEYDGRSELSPLDEGQLRGIARRVVAAGIRCIVVSGVFSPVNASQERQAAAVLADEAEAALAAERAVGGSSTRCGGNGCETGAQAGRTIASGVDRQQGAIARQGHTTDRPAEQQVFICQSHEMGQLGLLERENAAVLNAALLPLAQRVVPACQAALAAAGLSAQLWFTGNDGCLLSARDATRMPVATIQSGPVNSLRGAALLTGIQDGIVVDIGGTTTDVGALAGGLPRPAPRTVRLAGAPTNLQMPDVLSIGLGGGSLLRFPATDRGPGSAAAHRQAEQAEQAAEAGASGTDEAVHWGATVQAAAGTAMLAEERLQAPAPRCTVGPDSVGSRLSTEALCFGGQAATATDAAVLLGRMEVAGASGVAVGAAALGREQAEEAWEAMQGMLERAVDHAKTQAADVTVIVVGGAAALCGASLRGASGVLRPKHAAVANAVGAAIAQVGGSVDAVMDMGTTAESRAAALAAAQRRAEERALAAGALCGSCRVAAREEVPLAYLPGSVSRVRVRVVGQLQVARLGASQAASQAALPPGDEAAPAESLEGTPQAAGMPRSGMDSPGPAAAAAEQAPGWLPAPAAPANAPAAVEAWPPLPGRGEEPCPAVLAAWRPRLSPAGQWLLEEPDLHLIAVGCGILGCGGGGSPGRALLKALMELKRLGPGSMRVISPASVADADLVADAGYMGAPTVGLEKLDSDQAEAALRGALEALRAAESDTAPGGSTGAGGAGASARVEGQGAAVAIAGARAAEAIAGTPAGTADALCSGAATLLAAVMAGEVGGGNGVEPLVVGARLGLPVVDGDLMGRAFPELQMMTSAIYGLPITPAALADEKGNMVVAQRAADASWLERLLRPLCTELGCSAGFSARPLTGAQLQQVVVPHSLSLAWRLGQAVAAARSAKQDTAAAVAKAGGGRVLFTGKVVDVRRRTSGGFARGQLRLAGAGMHSGHSMRIDFQNENLLACLWPPADVLNAPAAATGGKGKRSAAAGDGEGPGCATAAAESSRSATPEEAPGLAATVPAGDAAAQVVASVPDLICCIESETGLPIATEEMRYGLRAAVLGLPAHPLLTTPQALEAVGPAAFGHGDVLYAPLPPRPPPLAGIPG